MISVCMAAYNGQKYIKKQLESILQQLGGDDEVLISDDGSKDDTVKIIQSLNDSRVKILSHTPDKTVLKNHFGQYTVIAKNFENALSIAKGDYIFMSDQDDLWDSGRIANTIEELQNNILVMTNFKIIDEDDKPVTDRAFYDNPPIFDTYIRNIIKCRFMCCCLAFRKDLLKYVLPFPNNIESTEQWMGCIASKVGNVKFLSDVCHLYRRHGSNVSETTEVSRNSLYYKIRFRLKLNYLINKRLKQYAF